MKIMEKGQITIPKKFRELYGITKNTELEILPKEEGLLIVKKTARVSPFREVFGLLKKHERTDMYIDKIRGS